MIYIYIYIYIYVSCCTPYVELNTWTVPESNLVMWFKTRCVFATVLRSKLRTLFAPTPPLFRGNIPHGQVRRRSPSRHHYEEQSGSDSMVRRPTQHAQVPPYASSLAGGAACAAGAAGAADSASAAEAGAFPRRAGRSGSGAGVDARNAYRRREGKAV